MTPLVEIARLEKSYEQGGLRTPILHGVSMAFDRGSFVAIVGPSGCGKTTLLTLLGALDRADSGSIRIDGLELVGASPADLTQYRRRDVGFVFQFYNLLPSLTAVENVESGLEFLPASPAVRRKRAMDYLARVGLADSASKFPAQLSGGQQQRVAVARGLAREPKLLLADEPTGNLDQDTGERVFEVMRSIVRECGVTCVMVTHDHELAMRADAIVPLRDGRLATDAARGPVPAPRESGIVLGTGHGVDARPELRAGNWK